MVIRHDGLLYCRWGSTANLEEVAERMPLFGVVRIVHNTDLNRVWSA